MIKIEFTSEEIDTLEYERYHHPDPKTQKKIESFYLKSQKLEHQEICRLCRISKPALVAYLKQYQEGGIEQLKKFGYTGQPIELDKHAASLKTYFEEHPPRTIAEAQLAIQEQTGIQRSPLKFKLLLNGSG